MGSCWSRPGSASRPSRNYRVAVEPRRADTLELERVSVVKEPIKDGVKKNSLKENAQNGPDVKHGWVAESAEKTAGVSNGEANIMVETTEEDQEQMQAPKETSVGSPALSRKKVADMVRQESVVSMSSCRMSFPVPISLGKDKTDSLRVESGSRGDTMERMGSRNNSSESLRVDLAPRMRNDSGEMGCSLENVCAIRSDTMSMLPMRGSIEVFGGDNSDEAFWIPDSLASHIGYDSSLVAEFQNKPCISLNDQRIDEEDELGNSEDSSPVTPTKENDVRKSAEREDDDDERNSGDISPETPLDMFPRKRCYTFTSEDLVTMQGSEEESSGSEDSTRVYAVNEEMTVLAVDPESVVTEVNALTGKVDSLTVQIYKEYSRERLDQIDDEDERIKKYQAGQRNDSKTNNIHTKNGRDNKSTDDEDVQIEDANDKISPVDEEKEYRENLSSIDEENNIKSANNTVSKHVCQDCDRFIKEGDAKVLVKPVDSDPLCNNPKKNSTFSESITNQRSEENVLIDSADLVSTCVSYDDHHHRSSIKVFLPGKKNNPEIDAGNDLEITNM